MRALTPADLTQAGRSLRFLRLAVPTFRPQPRKLPAGRFRSRLSAGGFSRLHHGKTGSPQRYAESGSSSCGLPVHLRLLPTPPRGDAVTFDYGACDRLRRGLAPRCQSVLTDAPFPAKAGIHCVPRMALNLEVQVLFGPQGAEPLAKGNCVAAMRGGEEAGGKTGSRRTETGYKASAVGQPGSGRGRPILLLIIARVDLAAASGKCSALPWETSSALRANRSRVSVTASDGRGGVSRGHSSACPQGRREGPNL